MHPLRLYSNFTGFRALLGRNANVDFRDFSDMSLAQLARRVWRDADCLILNIDHRRLYGLCALLLLIAPRGRRRCRVVSVDILLRPQFGLKGRALAAIKRVLLRQVDTFILYFRNWDGYVRLYGIPRERIEYVPFKANSWEYLRERSRGLGDCDHVLCLGATLRDWDTFVEAVRIAGVPAVLVVPGEARESIAERSWYRNLPPSLRLVYHQDGQEKTYLGYFESARVVCIPRYRWDIASTGISAYLCAMALNRCVAISKGPGAEDVLAQPGAAAFFEPEDVRDLARTLSRLWSNDDLRREIAQNGRHYAEQLEGEPRMLRDILEKLGYGELIR